MAGMIIARKFITRLPVDVDHVGRLTAIGVPVYAEPDCRLPDSLFWPIDAALHAKAAAEGSNMPVALHHACWLLRCRRCNAPFIGPSEARLCSDACRSAARRDSVRRAIAKRAGVRKARNGEKTVACAQCGRVIPAVRSTRKYCSSTCRMAGHRVSTINHACQ
jgi:hypothetical protein